MPCALTVTMHSVQLYRCFKLVVTIMCVTLNCEFLLQILVPVHTSFFFMKKVESSPWDFMAKQATWPQKSTSIYHKTMNVSVPRLSVGEYFFLLGQQVINLCKPAKIRHRICRSQAVWRGGGYSVQTLYFTVLGAYTTLLYIVQNILNMIGLEYVCNLFKKISIHSIRVHGGKRISILMYADGHL
jgi:hypothetical protein